MHVGKLMKNLGLKNVSLFKLFCFHFRLLKHKLFLSDLFVLLYFPGHRPTFKFFWGKLFYHSSDLLFFIFFTPEDRFLVIPFNIL